MYPCEIQQKPAVHTLSVRFRAPVQDLPRHFSEAYHAVGLYLSEQGLTTAGPAYAAYHNMDMADLDVEAGFRMVEPVAGSDTIQAGRIDAGTYAICHYTGAYEGFGPVYEYLTQYVAKEGYAPSGMALEWYLNGPDEVSSPDELRTDICFPVIRIDARAPQAL